MIGLLLCVLVTIAALMISGVIYFANMMRSSPGPFEGRGGVVIVWVAVALCWLWWGLDRPAFGRDLDGRYANSPLKQWFDTLKSGKGPCCSDADGYAVSDPDWDSKDGHYRVRIEGEWYDVPDDAVITEPNRAGRTMVWPIKGWGGLTIRCFMPGSMT